MKRRKKQAERGEGGVGEEEVGMGLEDQGQQQAGGGGGGHHDTCNQSANPDLLAPAPPRISHV